MEKCIGISAIIVGLFIGLCFGQSIKIHTKKTVESFKLSEIDSVTFELGDAITAPVTNLRIEDNEISGWSEDKSGYAVFANSDQLMSIVNGAAVVYQQYLVDGFIQELSKESAGRTCRYFIVNCGNAEKAVSLYKDRTGNITQKTSVGNYPASTAIANIEPLSGCCAYANFGQYYAEITLDGFNLKSESIFTVAGFLEVLQVKIDSLSK